MVVLGAFAQHLVTTWEGFEACASDDDSDVEDSDRSEVNDSSDAYDGGHDDEGSDIVDDNNASAEETYYSREGETKSRSESESFSRQDDRSSSNDSRRTDTNRSGHSGEASTAASRSGHSGERGHVDFRSENSGDGGTTGSESVYSGEGSTPGGRSVYSGEANSAGSRSVYSGEASSAGSRSVYSGEASSAGSRSMYSSEASSGDSTRSRSYGSEDDDSYYSGSAAGRSYQSGQYSASGGRSSYSEGDSASYKRRLSLQQKKSTSSTKIGLRHCNDSYSSRLSMKRRSLSDRSVGSMLSNTSAMSRHIQKYSSRSLENSQHSSSHSEESASLPEIELGENPKTTIERLRVPLRQDEALSAALSDPQLTRLLQGGLPEFPKDSRSSRRSQSSSSHSQILDSTILVFQPVLDEKEQVDQRHESSENATTNAANDPGRKYSSKKHEEHESSDSNTTNVEELENRLLLETHEDVDPGYESSDTDATNIDGPGKQLRTETQGDIDHVYESPVKQARNDEEQENLLRNPSVCSREIPIDRRSLEAPAGSMWLRKSRKSISSERSSRRPSQRSQISSSLDCTLFAKTNFGGQSRWVRELNESQDADASNERSSSMSSSYLRTTSNQDSTTSVGQLHESPKSTSSRSSRKAKPSRKSRTPKSTVSMELPLLEAKEKTDQGYESSDTDSTKSHDHETQLLVVLEDREDIVGSAYSNTDTANDDDQPFDTSSETDAGRSYSETKTFGSPAEISEYPRSPSVSHTIASPSRDTPQSNPERNLSMEATLSIFSASSNASSRPASSRSQRRHPSITENVHTDYQPAGEASMGLVDVFGASRLGIQESSMGLEDVFGSPPANKKHPGSDGSQASIASEISRESIRLSKPDCSSDSKHSAISDASRLPNGPVGDSAFGRDSLVDGDVGTSSSSKGAFEGAFGTELLDSTGDQRDESSSPCSTTSSNTSNGQPDVSSPRGSSGHSRDTGTARQLKESSHLRLPSNSRRNISRQLEASSGQQRSSHSMDTTVRSEGSTTSHGGPSGHSRDTASSSGRSEESGNLRASTPSMDTRTIGQSEGSSRGPADSDNGRSEESFGHRSSHSEASSHKLPTPSRQTSIAQSDGSNSRQSSAPSSHSQRKEDESRFPVPSSDRSDESKRPRSSAHSKDEDSRGSEVLSRQRPSTHSRKTSCTRGEESGHLLPLPGSSWQVNSGWSEESSQSIKGNRESFAKRDESWKNGSSRPSHRQQSSRHNTAHALSAHSGRRNQQPEKNSTSGGDKASRTDGSLEGTNPAIGPPRRAKTRPTEATSTGRNSQSTIDVSSTSRSLEKSTRDYDFDPDRPVSSIEAKPSSMMSSQYSGESPRSLPKPVSPNEILGFLKSLSSSGDKGGKKFKSPEKKKVAPSAKSRAPGTHHLAEKTSKQPTKKTSMMKSTTSEIALEDAGLVPSASQDHATPATNTPVASLPMAYLTAPHALFHGLRDAPLLDTSLPTSRTLIDHPVPPVEIMSAPLLDRPSLDVEYSPSHSSALSSWPEQPHELEPVSPLPSPQHTGINEAAHQSDVIPISRPLAVLRQMHVPFRSNLTNIYCSIQNEGYLEAVEKSYLFLLELRPRLRYLFSLSEWIHIHALILYARVFDCELAASGITLPLPPQFRIELPRHLSVLEPLAVVLESIGIVEDRAKGVRYIPVAKPRVFGEEEQVGQKGQGRQGDYESKVNIIYNNITEKKKPYVRPDPEDVTEFLEWTQYPWTQSWIKVEQAREARLVMALADGIMLPTKSSAVNQAKLLEWEHLALEKWLGWDDALWSAYDQTVEIFQNQLSFVPFPNQSPWGTYSWLLARHVVREAAYNTNRGNEAVAMCRLPNPGLPPEVWMIGLLFNFSGVPLEDQLRLEWYYETVPTNGIPDRLLVFLASAVISKPLTGL